VVGFRIRSVGHEKGPEVSAPGLFFVKTLGAKEVYQEDQKSTRTRCHKRKEIYFASQKGRNIKKEEGEGLITDLGVLFQKPYLGPLLAAFNILIQNLVFQILDVSILVLLY